MNFSMIFSAVDRSSRVIGRVMRSTERLKGAAVATTRATAKAARASATAVTYATATMTAGLGASAAAAMDFESSMADVNKVADFASPAQFRQFSEDILSMSTRIPVVASGLADISAEAASAGIALEDNLKFTEFVAKSSVAFDMAAGRAGESFAKIRNVYKLSQTGVEGMADAVNHLSNSMASKAPEIIDFINRAGGAAPMLKASATEMAAIGSAMIATGTAPEVAARGLTTLATRLEVGTPKIQKALKSVGLSHKEMVEALEADPGQALITLFEALSKSENGTEALSKLVGQDFVDDFSKLTANTDMLAKSLELVGEKSAFAGSVQAEYATRAATTANSLDLMKNNLNALAIEVGNKALPSINVGLENAIGFLQSARTESGRLQAAFESITVFWKDLFAAMEPWGETILASLDGVSAAFSKLGETIGRIFSLFTGDDEAASFGHVVGTVLAGSFNLLLGAVEAAVNGLDMFLTGVENVIKWFQGKEVDWSSFIPEFPAFDNAKLQEAVDFMVGIVQKGWDVLGGIFNSIVAAAGALGEAVGLAIEKSVAGAEAALAAISGSKGIDRIFDQLGDLAERGYRTDFVQGQALTEALATGIVSLEGYRAELAATATAGGQFSETAQAMIDASRQLDAFKMPEAPVPDVPSPKELDASLSKLSAIQLAALQTAKAVDAAMGDIDTALTQLDFTDHGVALMRTLAEGIRLGTPLIVAATAAATQKVRDHLPSSPAKTGPLSDIHKLKFGETIAKSIHAAPMVAAIRAAAGATMRAASASLTDARDAISARAIAQSASSNARNGGGGISVTIGDTIIQGGSPTAQADLKQAAAQNERQLIRTLERYLSNKERGKF